MKRILAVAVLTGASLWLGGGPAHASTTASIKVSPGWTWNDGGKLAVTVSCPASGDVRVVFSRMLSTPVYMRNGGKLLIEVTDKTIPGEYGIELVCEPLAAGPSHSARNGSRSFSRFPAGICGRRLRCPRTSSRT